MYSLRTLNTFEIIVIILALIAIVFYLVRRYIKKFDDNSTKVIEEREQKEIALAIQVMVRSIRIPTVVVSFENEVIAVNSSFEELISNDVEGYVKYQDYILDFLASEDKHIRLERDINERSYYIDVDTIKSEVFEGIIIMYSDITEILDLYLKQENFIRDIKHEINTPITAIQGLSDLLLENKIEDKEDRYNALKTIRNETYRMNSLVKSLSEEMKSDTELSEVFLDDIFNDLRLIYKDVSVYMRISNFVEEPIISNANIIKQILINLIDNSIKFTKSGRITISALQSGDNINIAVVDTGVGISEEQLNHIFERFYKADKARSNDNGFGLGLSIVKSLVTKINGRIEVDSREEKGSTFSLIIPYNTKK